jgi:hypothetical protein
VLVAVSIFVVMLVAGLIFSTIQYVSWRSSLAVMGAHDPPIKIGFLALLGTAAGVLASYYVIQKRFDLNTPNIIGAAIATVFANLGSFLLMKDRKDFGYLDFLSFMKDGFLWSSTYPALAAAFHQIPIPVKG